MKQHHWSQYRKADGVFTGRRYSASRIEAVQGSVTDELGLWPGQHDHLSQRIDLQTAQVVDYQPPAPGEEHDWNPDSKRWEVREAVLLARANEAGARAEIQSIENASARALRELLLDPTNEEARARVRAADDLIAGARSRLKRP